MGWKLPGILNYLPTPTVAPRKELAKTISMLPDQATIVDVGAGGRRITQRTITVDAVSVDGVDVIGDIHALPLADACADAVVCTGTLEHVQNPRVAVTELYRILKPQGLVHIDVPFIQGYHPDPTDYWRFTLDGLRLLCARFEEIDSGVHIGPTSGLVWIVREWANSLSSNNLVSNLLLVPTSLATAPLKYLDYLLISGDRAHHVASAVYFRGRKPPHSQHSCSRTPIIDGLKRRETR